MCVLHLGIPNLPADFKVLLRFNFVRRASHHVPIWVNLLPCSLKPGVHWGFPICGSTFCKWVDCARITKHTTGPQAVSCGTIRQGRTVARSLPPQAFKSLRLRPPTPEAYGKTADSGTLCIPGSSQRLDPSAALLSSSDRSRLAALNVMLTPCPVP